MRIWLVSSALDCVEGRVWIAHTTITSRGCQRFPLLLVTALLSVFVAYGHVTGCVFLRICQVVLLLCHPTYRVFSWLLHVHSWTSAHLKPWTAQDVITLCSSHSCLTDPNSFSVVENPRKWCPVFRSPPPPSTHTPRPANLHCPFFHLVALLPGC